MKVVAIVPIKMNNERTPGKNTKLLSDGTPLMHLIQKTLLESKKVDEIYVYCSREDVQDYMLDGVNYIKRDPKYDTAQADVLDMFYNFSLKVDADIYVLAHATAPFLKPSSVDESVKNVMSGDYDSAIAVNRLYDFLWKDGKPLNYVLDKIPRTQDLEPIYKETTGMYVFTRDVIQKMKRRVGSKPYLCEVDEFESVDINNPVDFEIADAVYTYLKNK